MWILRSSSTDIEPVTFRLPAGSVKTIGRAHGADVIIDAALVSRVHCRLEARRDGIDVVDLSSTNGTFVNDRRIERTAVSNGDRIRIGRVELVIERADD